METGLVKLEGTEAKYSLLKDPSGQWMELYYFLQITLPLLAKSSMQLGSRRYPDQCNGSSQTTGWMPGDSIHKRRIRAYSGIFFFLH